MKRGDVARDWLSKIYNNIVECLFTTSIIINRFISTEFDYRAVVTVLKYFFQICSTAKSTTCTALANSVTNSPANGIKYTATHLAGTIISPHNSRR